MTTQVNGKRENSTPDPSETPKPIVTKIYVSGDVGDTYHYAKFHHDTITPFRPPNMRKYASSDSASFFGSFFSLQPRPLNRFWRSVRQMTLFRTRMCLFGVSKTKFHISSPFFPEKNANFRQCSTGFRKFRVKKALTMGCSPANYP